jgi:TetR/AcrR family transcriptional regulator, cholesterol catabolism regulator
MDVQPASGARGPARRGWHDRRTVERETKSDRTRARILDAAADVFSEQGYGARLSDIADRAGMKAGSLYYHFDSREDLVREILHRGIETSFDHVRTAVDALGPGGSAIERLAAAVRAHTMAILEISAYASARARIVGQVPPAVAKAHQRDQRAYGTYWNELFEAAQAQGDIAGDVDLFVVRMLALGAMNWIAEWAPLAATRSADAIADQTVRAVLDGVRARPQG